MLHDIFQRREMAIVHIGTRRSLAQAGRAELAEIAVQALHVPGAQALAPDMSSLCLPKRLKVLLASLPSPSSRPASTSPGRVKNGIPTSPNSPLVKRGPKWQAEQFASMKIFGSRAAPCQRIARHGLAIARQRRRGKHRTACAD